MAVLDEDEDAFAGVAAADADVVESAVVAQGEFAADGVVADAPGGVVEADAGGDGFGAGLVGLEGGASREGAVGALGVVVAGEGVELVLQSGG